MKKIIFFLLISSVVYSQEIPTRIDGLTDVYADADSIVLLMYGDIPHEDWLSLDPSSSIDMEVVEKSVLVYKDGILHQEFNYLMKDTGWTINSEVLYEINGSEVVETTTGYFGGKGVSISEEYNLDYIWVTKLRPIDVVSSDIAGKLLFDETAMEIYQEKILEIINGKITTDKGLKLFYNTQNKLIRQQRLVKSEENILLESTNYLNTEKTKNEEYNLHLDITRYSGNKIDYKYKLDGEWKYLRRFGKLTERVIYK